MGSDSTPPSVGLPEPVASYRGVLRYAQSVGRVSVRYKIALVHRANENRNVDLHAETFVPGMDIDLLKRNWRRQQKRYARLLGLPALVESDEGFVERRPEDLDKSVRQLVQEGAVEVRFDPTAPPPGRKLDVRADGRTLTLKAGVVSRWVLAVGVPLILVGPLAIGAALNENAGADAIVAAGWAVAGLLVSIQGAVLCALGLVRAELSVSPDEVRWRWALAGKRGKRISADDIQEVVVTRPLREWLAWYRVRVVSDERMIEFGTFLSRHEKRWVRDCIIAVISAPADEGQ